MLGRGQDKRRKLAEGSSQFKDRTEAALIYQDDGQVQSLYYRPRGMLTARAEAIVPSLLLTLKKGKSRVCGLEFHSSYPSAFKNKC